MHTEVSSSAVNVHNPSSIAECKLSHCVQQIFRSDVDFTKLDENELKLKEKEKMYPPKFQVVISCSPAAQQSQARIKIKGAHSDLVFDIPLTPLPGPSINPQQGRINNANTHDLWIES